MVQQTQMEIKGHMHKMIRKILEFMLLALGSMLVAITQIRWMANRKNGSPNTAKALEEYPFGWLSKLKCVASESGSLSHKSNPIRMGSSVTIDVSIIIFLCCLIMVIIVISF